MFRKIVAKNNNVSQALQMQTFESELQLSSNEIY